MMERILRLLPWYSPEAQERRAKRTAEAHRRAIQTRMAADRVLHEYQRADTVRHRPTMSFPQASRPPDDPKVP
jgi:hypothetical protein